MILPRFRVFGGRQDAREQVSSRCTTQEKYATLLSNETKTQKDISNTLGFDAFWQSTRSQMWSVVLEEDCDLF